MRECILSVVVPLFNEQEVLPETYRRLTAAMEAIGLEYEIILVNDGSRDDTLVIACGLAALDKRIRIVDFSRNFGHQAAVTAGLERAAGRAAVIIDADLQDPPEVIAQMVEKWREGYDVVYGKRIKRKGESAFKKLTAFLFYRFLRAMTSTQIPADAGDFRLIDRKVIDTLNSLKEKNRFLRGMVAWVGFKQTAVEFERDKRFAGVTKYPFKAMLRLAANGIIAFSDKPLTLGLYLGVGLLLIALFSLVALIVLSLTIGIAAWWYALWAGVLLQALVLCVIGLQGVYVSRLCDEARERPVYIVRDEYGFKDVQEE